MTKILEKRVEKLKQELTPIKRQLASQNSTGGKDWRRTIGRFKDDPLFDEIRELGAAYRRRQPKC